MHQANTLRALAILRLYGVAPKWERFVTLVDPSTLLRMLDINRKL